MTKYLIRSRIDHHELGKFLRGYAPLAGRRAARGDRWPADFRFRARKETGGEASCNSDGSAAAILLLHGYPTSCHDWRGVAEQLAARHHTIAPDFLGFGLSDKPEAFGYSLFQQADMIEGLLRELAIGGAHIVSHDMGTSVHCELLARQAEGRLGFELRTSTFLNGSMLQWMAKITPFQELLASNATLPQAIDFCRTVMPGVYVDALRGLMQSPAAITPDDVRVMEELLRYQDGHLRLPALAGYTARALTSMPTVGLLRWN